MASKAPQLESDISPIPMDQDLAVDDLRPADALPGDAAGTDALAPSVTAPADIGIDAAATATPAAVPEPESTSAKPADAVALGRSVRGGNMEMRVLSRAMRDLDVLTGGTRAATYDEVDEYVGHAIRIERELENAARAAQQGPQHQPASAPAGVQQPMPADDVKGEVDPAGTATSPAGEVRGTADAAGNKVTATPVAEPAPGAASPADGADSSGQAPDADGQSDNASLQNAVYVRPLGQPFALGGGNTGLITEGKAPPAAYFSDISRRQTTLPNPSDKMLAHAQTLQAAKKPGPAGKPGSPVPSAPRESRIIGITINRANAGSWAKFLKFDPDAPIFIGGGGDGYGFDNVRDFVKKRGKGTFFRHMDNEGIDAAIAINYALGKPIILVGHSWGAYAAMTAASRAAKKGIRVDLLETIDPVDGPIRALNSVTSDNVDDLKSKVGLWVDVRATKYETSPDWNDGVASRGGRFDSAAQSRADVYLESNRDHAAFEQMYHEVLTDRMIQTIYYNYKHK